PRSLLPIVSLFVASAATEAALLPAGALFFSRVTFAGLALNFLAIPLMAVAQIAGMAIVPLALISSRLAPAGGGRRLSRRGRPGSIGGTHSICPDAGVSACAALVVGGGSLLRCACHLVAQPSLGADACSRHRCDVDARRAVELDCVTRR